MKRNGWPMALFVLAAMAYVWFLHGYTVTGAENPDFSVYGGESGGWTITELCDGAERSVDAQGAVDSKNTVFLKRTIPESWGSYDRIRLDGMRAVCIYVDDDLVFSNFAAAPDAPGAIGAVSLPEGQPFFVTLSVNPSWAGKTLTLATALASDAPFASISFTLISDNANACITSAWASAKAMPTAAFGLLALMLLGLFLFRLTLGQGAYPVLLLSLASFLQMLRYQDGLVGSVSFPIDFTTAGALFFLLPPLYAAFKMERKRPLFLCLCVSAWAVYFCSIAAWNLFYLPVPMWFDRLAYITVLLFVLLFVFAGLECRHGSVYFRRFLSMSALFLLFFLAVFALSGLCGLPLWDWLLVFLREAAAGYPEPAMFGVFTVILLIEFVLAVWELVERSAQTAKQMEQFRLREELTAQSLASMEKTNEALAKARHDELHHLRAISSLFKEDAEKAEAYAASLTNDLTNIPTMRYTQNKLINAILSVQAGQASGAKVSFNASASLPESIPIPDRDITTVLMNLTGNAIKAAESAPASQEKRVSVLLKIEDNTLSIEIENSLPENFDRAAFRSNVLMNAKRNSSEHGYGILSAKEVAARYHGELKYTVTEETITVRTALSLLR